MNERIRGLDDVGKHLALFQGDRDRGLQRLVEHLELPGLLAQSRLGHGAVRHIYTDHENARDGAFRIPHRLVDEIQKALVRDAIRSGVRDKFHAEPSERLPCFIDSVE